MGVSSRDRKIATQIVGLIQFFISLVQQFIESKSNGIDKILDKVPKISADMIAPSLTKSLSFCYILAYLLVTGN